MRLASLAAQAAQGNQAANSLTIANSESLDPAKKPLTVEAWISLNGPNGVIVSHGGPANGYALVLRQRTPAFMIRSGGELATVEAPERLEEGWNHLAGVLDADHSLRLYVNGSLAAEAQTANLIASAPKQPLELGADSAGSVGDYQTPFAFAGTIDEVRLYHRALTADEIALSVNDAEKARERSKEAALALTFDAGNAKDESGNKNDGQIGKLPTGQGKLGTALVIPRAAGGNAQPAGVAFQHTWTRFAPVFARSMVLTGLAADHRRSARRCRQRIRPGAVGRQGSGHSREPSSSRTRICKASTAAASGSWTPATARSSPRSSSTAFPSGTACPAPTAISTSPPPTAV